MWETNTITNTITNTAINFIINKIFPPAQKPTWHTASSSSSGKKLVVIVVAVVLVVEIMLVHKQCFMRTHSMLCWLYQSTTSFVTSQVLMWKNLAIYRYDTNLCDVRMPSMNDICNSKNLEVTNIENKYPYQHQHQHRPSRLQLILQILMDY